MRYQDHEKAAAETNEVTGRQIGSIANMVENLVRMRLDIAIPVALQGDPPSVWAELKTAQECLERAYRMIKAAR
jgi:hypothetical protein